jgi:cytochrome c-type biogenesis protein CcmH/NrfG
VTRNAAVDRILHAVAPGAGVDLRVLNDLLANRPRPEVLLPLLADRDPETVRAVIVFLGMFGSLRECPLLALCLQHHDLAVVQLAEYCLWAIWMRSGSTEGNRHLTEAVHAGRVGNHEEAVRTLCALTALEPGFSEAHFQLGLALAALERHDEAVRAFRQSLRLNPYHFAAAAALGHAHVALNNLHAALQAYRQAVRIHPHLDDIPQAIGDLEILTGRGATDQR